MFAGTDDGRFKVRADRMVAELASRWAKVGAEYVGGDDYARAAAIFWQAVVEHRTDGRHRRQL